MTLQEYIQKDIERLEGEIRDMRYVEDGEVLTVENKTSVNTRNAGYNKALQTIIDIKRKELEELNKNV